MKKARKAAKARKRSGDEMRTEYDFSGGVRGKYSGRYRDGTNVVVLAPDVAQEFRTERAVNEALRGVLKQRSSRRTA
jgi:hypothetical protein